MVQQESRGDIPQKPQRYLRLPGHGVGANMLTNGSLTVSGIRVQMQSVPHQHSTCTGHICLVPLAVFGSTSTTKWLASQQSQHLLASSSPHQLFTFQKNQGTLMNFTILKERTTCKSLHWPMPPSTGSLTIKRTDVIVCNTLNAIV